jgi:hypothetical protein
VNQAVVARLNRQRSFRLGALIVMIMLDSDYSNSGYIYQKIGQVDLNIQSVEHDVLEARSVRVLFESDYITNEGGYLTKG